MKYIKSHWWYRDTTKEWVWEWTIDIGVDFHGTYRYPARTKFGCFTNYLRFCTRMWKDYFIHKRYPFWRRFRIKRRNR